MDCRGDWTTPAFELFVIVLKIEIVLQVRLKNHEKYISAYQNFLENYLELNMYLNRNNYSWNWGNCNSSRNLLDW